MRSTPVTAFATSEEDQLRPAKRAILSPAQRPCKLVALDSKEPRPPPRAPCGANARLPSNLWALESSLFSDGPGSLHPADPAICIYVVCSSFSFLGPQGAVLMHKPISRC